jgi:hypothetical protein
MTDVTVRGPPRARDGAARLGCEELCALFCGSTAAGEHLKDRMAN